jgi:hypothetical protein
VGCCSSCGPVSIDFPPFNCIDLPPYVSWEGDIYTAQAFCRQIVNEGVSAGGSPHFYT